ncbi:MAG: ATP-binding protein [Flavobacteriales bacterium]|nr:ATP-binding protein [Flavobacteriales bacterium]
MAAAKRTLKFPSILENIHLAEKLIDDVVAEYGVKEDYYGELLIAMTEAVNNAIVHGNKLDPAKQVTLTFDIIEDRLMRFMIEDEGPGFDYDHLPDPTAPENIEKPHGRGVFLMRKLADQCDFQDNGRIVILDFAVLANDGVVSE